MNMNSRNLEIVAEDLLSIPPIIFRIVRNKLIKTTLIDIGADITPHQFEIIRLLMEEGTLHVAEICQRLQIAKAQMTQLIDKLVDLNIVERKLGKTDRRIINIALTAQGRTLLEEHKNSVIRAVNETMSFLTEKELEDLSDSLRKLRDILMKLH
jgi:DNA-binding MarR family transcriptional regulator